MKSTLRALATRRLRRDTTVEVAQLGQDLRAALVRWDLPTAHKIGARLRQLAPTSWEEQLAARKSMEAKLKAFLAAEAGARDEAGARSTGDLTLTT